jgi:hypothetical protein
MKEVGIFFLFLIIAIALIISKPAAPSLMCYRRIKKND